MQIGAEEAELVYRTADDRPYDVAVLRLASGNDRQWKPIEFATKLPVKGLINFFFFLSLYDDVKGVFFP